MSENKKELKLGVFIDRAGNFLSSWRHENVPANALTTFDYYKDIAQTAERGKLDMIFFADTLQVFPENNFKHAITFNLEPIVEVSTLASVTKHIGLAATVSSSYNEPYNVARKFATLDHFSNGRAAWNLVTSTKEGEAKNYNRESNFQHAERYEIAEEFLTVAKNLWDSWADDAIIANKKEAIFADPEKVHAINHQGKYFSVQGPLNVPRPIQGHPVIIQAGSSADGKSFASRNADVIFTVTPEIEKAKAFYADIKKLTVEQGRDADDVKIMPGIIPLIGGTKEEALSIYKHFQNLLIPESAVKHLSEFLELDLSSYPLHEPLPELPDVSNINGQKGRYQIIVDSAKKNNLTLAEAATKFASSRMHHVVCGTAEEIADMMEQWLNEQACDGFNILPPYFPGGFEEFVNQVIPILQERELFRKEYTGTTLREHLGLKRPVNTVYENKKTELVYGE